MEKIERFHGDEKVSDDGEWVYYDDHMAIVGPLVMENLTLKLENEAYQKHIKEMEDGKTN